MAPTIAVDDDDLFELDIDLLGRRLEDDDNTTRLRRINNSHSAAADDDDDDGCGGHALLANCVLPVSSVSNAVPVGTIVSTTSYPYAGYYCGSRRLFTTGSSSKRFLFGCSSARFCFSSSGFETTGNYFQRY